MTNITLKITEEELRTLVDAIDTLSAIIGTGDDGFDSSTTNTVKVLDKMLNKNGYARKRN